MNDFASKATGFPRFSPIRLPGVAAETESRGDWTVVRRFSGEGGGPWLIDLSHCDKWDVQDAALDQAPAIDDVPLPTRVNQCVFREGRLLMRPSETRAVLWRLRGEPTPLPYHRAFTDVTDGCALLALAGSEVPDILEKATTLDALPPGAEPPYLLQGPVFQRPCLLAMMLRRPDMTVALVAGQRGYGRYMAEAFLEVGEEFGMLPAGEDRFWSVLAPPEKKEEPEGGAGGERGR
ncbi:MAG: sarcosine oxidase subunit gamma SoxG [Desulfococcaceae bacterium]